jgi:hypothetical protein
LELSLVENLIKYAHGHGFVSGLDRIIRSWLPLGHQQSAGQETLGEDEQQAHGYPGERLRSKVSPPDIKYPWSAANHGVCFDEMESRHGEGQGPISRRPDNVIAHPRTSRQVRHAKPEGRRVGRAEGTGV